VTKQKQLISVCLLPLRKIYMFLIIISTLDLKYSVLKPVRLVMSGLLRMQTMFIMLFVMMFVMLFAFTI